MDMTASSKISRGLWKDYSVAEIFSKSPITNTFNGLNSKGQKSSIAVELVALYGVCQWYPGSQLERDMIVLRKVAKATRKMSKENWDWNIHFDRHFLIKEDTLKTTHVPLGQKRNSSRHWVKVYPSSGQRSLTFLKVSFLQTKHNKDEKIRINTRNLV